MQAGKSDVVVYDYVDDGVPVLARMHQKRLAGYRAMGYTVDNEPAYVEPLTFWPSGRAGTSGSRLRRPHQPLSASSRMRSNWAISGGRSLCTVS